jgi:hypothetical protein
MLSFGRGETVREIITVSSAAKASRWPVLILASVTGRHGGDKHARERR